MAKSLNRVQLIGNLTRDPELKYTPSGSAVCTFGIATNRSWTTDTGEKKEEVDFHNIVAWRKLAEICSQYLAKGRKAYVEGRLSTRSWTSQDGQQKSRTEVVIDDMIILDGRGGGAQAEGETRIHKKEAKEKPEPAKNNKEKQPDKSDDLPKQTGEEDVSPDDIPF